jgi:hypothetical protein
MTKILIDEAVVRQWLEAAYLAGFGATGEGYNAEYPFEGKDPEQDDNWLAHRDKYVRQALANEALDKKTDNARELGLSYEQPAQPWDEAAVRQALEALGWVRPNEQPRSEAALAPAQSAERGEPVAWMSIEQMYPQDKAIDILMGDGSILCAVLPQFDGDLWWEGSGTGEKFIDPKYANVTHWRIHGMKARPQAIEQPTPPECKTEAEKTAFAFGWFKALESVREQPAQQEPEYIVQSNGSVSPLLTHMMNKRVKSNVKQVIELYDSPKQPAQQKPTTDEFSEGWKAARQFYTTPPAPAQPLTDEQIDACKESVGWSEQWMWDFARAIEAAVLAKNGITKGELK